MIDTDALFADFDAMGLGSWRRDLAPLIDERLRDGAHGNLAAWKEVLSQIAEDQPTELLRKLLLQLSPWRKGPFHVCGIHIDAEWRSDLKWARVRERIAPLAGRNVLDVGCGNGYYAMQMRAAGAATVIGIDPSVLFVVQFEAIRKLTHASGIHVLPLRLEDIPPGGRAFDTTFSMGVLYHRRNPAEHLAALLDTLRPGGELVIETLVLPGDGRQVLEPDSRYARMRNVWHLPTVRVLLDWLSEAGFRNTRLVDVTATTIEEQRSTVWMPFESLAEALDPGDPTRTIEGYPSPSRAVVLADAPD